MPGVPFNLIKALLEHGAKQLTLVVSVADQDVAGGEGGWSMRRSHPGQLISVYVTSECCMAEFENMRG
jgi:hypothetical protein